jgi:uncharacterized peroxidase-related enzyme
LAAFVTSVLNETPHCSSGVEHKLFQLGVSRSLLAQVRRDPRTLEVDDERLGAVAAYATALTRSPGSITRSDIDGLRALGFSDLDILDLNNIVAYYNYINRVANGLGLRSVIPLDHALNSVPS